LTIGGTLPLPLVAYWLSKTLGAFEEPVDCGGVRQVFIGFYKILKDIRTAKKSLKIFTREA
jgi:hypothetical protein